MPTYEYACTSCGHRLEVHQKFSDEPLTTCPECGEPLRKVFGSVGIVLKGPGFYRTDSRNGASTSRSSKEAGAEKVASGSGADGASNGSSGSSSSPASNGSSGSVSSGSGSSSGSDRSSGSGSSGSSASGAPSSGSGSETKSSAAKSAAG